MRIGVFLVLFQNLPFEAALDKAVAAGVSAVEIGSGGYPAAITARWMSCSPAPKSASSTCTPSTRAA